jgi:hypothetical protein
MTVLIEARCSYTQSAANTASSNRKPGFSTLLSLESLMGRLLKL